MQKAHVAFLLFCLFFLFAILSCSDDKEDDSEASGQTPDDDASDDDNDDATGVDDDDDDNNDDDDFDPTGYVDPFMGSMADHGQLAPAASVPFGMVQLVADTLIRSHAGYDFGVPSTTGFSHTRIQGVGCSGAGGDIRILPGMGDQTVRALFMYKKTEAAQPGFYTVELKQNDKKILAEMTATQRVGLHRYTFPPDSAPYLFINFNDPLAGRIDSSWSAQKSNDEISGWVSGKNTCGRGAYTLYFSIQFDRPFTAVTELNPLFGGKNARVEFDPGKGEPLLVKVALSSVSAEEAALDRDLDIPDWDFDRVRKEARTAWRDHLSAVEVEGDSSEDLVTIFYTMLFRASHTPVDITTHSGKYRGTDGLVHQADYRRHHGWSLWDTYRNKFALHNLLYPERSSDIMQSLVDYYQEGKVDWSTDNEPYPNVRSEHAPALLLDAYRKGISGFDYAPAMDAIKAETLPGGSPDREMEGSFDRWAIAHLAGELGDTDTYDDYLALSENYQATWEEYFKEMGADADTVGAHGMYEGTLWQYRWAAVHDIPGMIALDGGRELFLSKLIQFFDEELYNHGNEPDIHAPFLFNYAGAPWRTQDLVRALLSEVVNQWYGGHTKWPFPAHRKIFRASPWGFITNMDDDAGTMSSWFVLAAVGLYPVTIGHPVYALTAPLFPKTVLHLEGGDLVIWAEDVSAENRYVQSATLNGEPLARAWLRHDEIAAGGELVFEMGSDPNEAWGAAAAEAPPGAFERSFPGQAFPNKSAW